MRLFYKKVNTMSCFHKRLLGLLPCTLAWLLLILLTAALSAPSTVYAQPSAISPEAVVRPALAMTPTLQVTPCADVTPALSLSSIPSTQAICGYVAVPLDHFSPTHTQTISLAVVIYPSTHPTPTTDALFILHGGPAASVLKSVSVLYGVERFYVLPFLDQRDVVVFDQRGTGVSLPALSCSSEAYHHTLETIGQIQTDRDFIDSQNAAYVACRQRLQTAGHTLEAYNSLQNAADVEQIRQALLYDGYIRSPQINLYGASYGTRLALTILREWSPHHLSPYQTGDEANVRSVMIEGVYPPEVSGYSRPFAIVRSLRLMFDQCSADPACNNAYPDLENVFIGLAEHFRQEPLTYTFTATVEGETATYNGIAGEQTFVDLVVGSMLNVDSVAATPQLIYTIQQGNTTRLQIKPSPTEAIDRATNFSIVCPEDLMRVSDFEYAMMFSVLESNFPYLKSSAYRSNISSPRMQNLCQTWGIPLVSEAMRSRVNSAVPTLVIAGNYDINTPPYFGESALQGLSQGQLITIPNLAHAGAAGLAAHLPSLKGCPHQLMQTFLAEPATPLADTSCLEELVVNWKLPEAALFLPVISR